jgi:hypothetical protein
MVANPLPIDPLVQDPGVAENLEVVRHRRGRHRGRGDDLACGQLTVAEEPLDDSEADRVAQGSKGFVDHDGVSMFA